jgi:hypothetical protein
MPTVLRHGPYRFHFWSADRAEPPHVHVERDRATAKFWLNPVRLVTSRNFKETELRKVRRIVEEHEQEFLRRWNEQFGR